MVLGGQTLNPKADSTIDHGLLLGLSDDDHTQYLLAAGTRALSADWDAGAFEIRTANAHFDTATDQIMFGSASGKEATFNVVTGGAASIVTFPYSIVGTVSYIDVEQIFTGEKTFGTNTKLLFRDSAISINSPSDGNMDIIADGGIFIKPASTVTIGSGAAGVDYIMAFDGQNNDGQFVWMEDEDYFRFDNSIYFNTTSESLTVALPASGNNVVGFKVDTGSNPGVYFARTAAAAGDITMENSANVYHQFGVFGAARIGDALHTDGTRSLTYDASLNTLTLSNGGGAFAASQMTTAQRNGMTPANGWIIYNTSTNQMEGYINGAWAAM